MIEHIKNQEPKKHHIALKEFSKDLNRNEIVEFKIADEIREQNKRAFINPANHKNSPLNDINHEPSIKSNNSKISARKL